VLAAGLATACASEAKYIEQGRLLLEQHEYDAAIEQFMAALEENPTSPQAHLNLGLVYVAQKRYDEAIKAIEQSLKSNESEDALVAMAIVYSQKQDFATAVSFMEKALQRAPDRASHHYRLGMIRRSAGDVERAADDFRMAMSQDPDLVEARVELGLTLKELKRYEEALDVLKDAVKDLHDIDTDVSGVQGALGEVYEAMEMLDYASHSFKLAIKNNASNADAIAGLGRVLRRQGSFEEAIELLAEGAQRMPQHAGIALELGLAYKDFRLEPQAIKELTRALQLDSTLAQGYAPLLQLLDEGKGSSEDVYKVVTAAASAIPDDIDIQLRAGKAASKHKEFDKAIEAYRRALEIEPSNVEANYHIGLAQLATGNFEGAMESLGALKYLDSAKAGELARAIEREQSSSTGVRPTKNKAKRRKRRRRRR
jgi:tetratricopeptide (TPR) repeat protein